MDGAAGDDAPASGRVLTWPNAISFARILLIPVFVVLIVDEGTTTAGLLLFSFVVATDWVDGWLARRTGQVSELGKILDPVADRLAIAAGLIALVIRGVFPLWAALLILVRDLAIVVVGGSLLAGKRIRIDVRWIGKLATFSLMAAIPWISWGTLELPLAELALVAGWAAFAIGIVEYYLAAFVYLRDIRLALAR
ncbi:MAG TPA: CDP-alcohol phosphatidyltransferase family protein [Actinomycetota bacterium]